MIKKLLPVFGILLVLFIGVYYTKSRSNSPAPKIASSQDYACVDPKTLSEATGMFEEGQTLAYFDNQKIAYPSSLMAQAKATGKNDVLGAYDSGGKEKWIEINLSKQQLTAWQGDQIFMQYPISSGLWGPTPPGTYSIYWKVRYIRMMGGDKALGDFYDLPNVPDTMFFYLGYGIHGAYWHNNFGHPMSHGCVNEPLDKAHILFEWAGPNINPDQFSVRATADNPGSRVFIH